MAVDLEKEKRKGLSSGLVDDSGKTEISACFNEHDRGEKVLESDTHAGTVQ